MKQLAVTLCIVLPLTFLVGCKVGKVIDPNDPGFEIGKFSCLDYPTDKYLLDVFRKYFPLGTDQQYIEDILIEQGGCLKLAEGAGEEDADYDEFTESAEMKRILLSLPVAHFAVYHITYKKPFISMVPSSMRPIVAVYDKNDKLIGMFNYIYPIHDTTKK